MPDPTGISAAIAAVATLLSQLFGWAVDPAGLAKMKLTHRLNVIDAGVKIALDKGDMAAADLLFAELRQLHDTKT
jgi:hypothetical protein